VLRTYEDGLRYLLGLTSRGIVPGLARVRRAFRLAGHPERAYPSIVIGGTNGKGSVSAAIARSLAEHGVTAGLFTSPHLHRLTERIRVGGREASTKKLLASLRRVAAIAERPGGPPLTFFETLTVVGADLFAREPVDVAVLEVGLGGRLDATRAFPSRVVVITSIDLDHQRFLGDTLESIAREKFALARRGAIVVAGELRPQLLPLLDAQVRRSRCALWMAGRDFTWELRPDGRLDYHGPGGELLGLHLALRGAHQAHNMAVAIAAMAAMQRRGMIPALSPDAMAAALAGLRWPGRLELAREGRVVLDVAHNPAGIATLCAEVPALAGGRRPVVAVLGCMRDKDVEGVVRPVARLADRMVLTAPRTARALPPSEFPAWIGGEPVATVEAAVDHALALAGDSGFVIVTGSTFVVAEARAHLLGIRDVDPLVSM
jgi:dihydrofolate synthase/folylpolyglutamate synthase